MNEKINAIKKFIDSKEWEFHKVRMEHYSSFLKEYGNPYFVAHESPLKDTSIVDGKEIINFASYNYLGLSGNKEVNQAAKDAIEKYGLSASGSRLLAGEKNIHRKLEKAIASWKHTEDAIVLVGGHSTNVTFVGNFCNENDLILYDVIIHNSIKEGLRMSKAKSKRFSHNNYDMLEKIIKKNREKYEKILIIVEGVYSMDGDIAPIDEYVKIKKKYGCFLMVDEAHSAGTIGANGGGVDEYFDLAPDDIDIKMGTMSKALGTVGGYLAGSKELIEYLKFNLPGFVFSVGVSPVIAAACLKSIEIIQRDNIKVKKLQENVKFFVKEAKKRGFDICLAGESPITPIMVGDEELAFKLCMTMLYEDSIFVPPAVYPAVPKKRARLRYCLTKDHKKEQITYALDVLKLKMEEIKKEKGYES